MTTGEQAYRSVPKSWRQARDALLVLSLGAWVAMSIVIALAGWATRSTLHQSFGLGLLALGLVVAGGTWVSRRWRLRHHAGWSLQARADLEGLELDENVDATLMVFDLATSRIRALLADPALADVVDAEAVNRELQTSGEELFELGRRSVALRADHDRLKRQAQTPVVESAKSANQEERARIDVASTRIAEELQALQSNIEATRTLARSASGSEDAIQRLAEARREIDAGAAAIKEIARLNNPPTAR